MSDASSQVLGGRYEIRYRVGSSAATEVSLARDRELDRDVAVKTLTPDRARDADVAERFRRMAAMAASLRDPNIVGVFDVAEAEVGPFMVMEYVDGTSLADTMRAQRLGLDRVSAIGADVARALGAAHRAGTVHGSLTPRDVLLGRDGSVKVTDFGAAAAGLAGITESPVEAAIYGSPERLQGGPADASGDLYSLGVLLHEAATGAPPFGGSDAVAITRDKLDRTPLPPSATLASVPPAFDAIVERLTSPNTARRYHSADEVAADLDRLREPVAPTRPLPTIVASQTTTAQTLPEKKSNAGWIAAIVILVLAIIGVGAWLLLRNDDSNKEKVTVPSVVGQPVLAAQAAIEAAGLQSTTVNQVSDTVEAGKVFDQSPPGASLAKKGTVIRLSVSTGPPPTTSTSTSSTTTTTTTTTSTTTTTTTLPTTTST